MQFVPTVRTATMTVVICGVLCSSAATGGDASAAPTVVSSPSRIVVGFAPGARRAVGVVESLFGGETVQTLPDVDAEVIAVPSEVTAAAITRLESIPGVRYVQLDGRSYAAAIPDDAYWPDEWSQVTTHAPQAWDLTTGSPSVVVAVVDTGVDAGQPDLAGRVLPGYDFVNGDSDAADDDGHGTAVAGVIAAAGNNTIGVAGYCWQCRVLPVKVLDAGGGGFNSSVAAGILWAVDHGATVINASLGSLDDDLVLSSAAQYAALHGVLVVAAAGNDGSATLRYPAALPSVLSVSASDANDQPYSFSNSGASLAAPGSNVTTGTQGTYVSFLGTSSAAPVVSGIAALAFSAAPAATATDVAQALESSATSSPGVVFGRVDAYAAVHLLAPQLNAGSAPTGQPAPVAPLPDRSARRTNAQGSITVRGRLTSSHRSQSYTVRAASGVLRASLTIIDPKRIRAELRLVAPDGSTIARRQGVGTLRLSLAVDPMSYRLVVSRPRAGAPQNYRLKVVYPTILDSTRR